MQGGLESAHVAVPPTQRKRLKMRYMCGWKNLGPVPHRQVDAAAPLANPLPEPQCRLSCREWLLLTTTNPQHQPGSGTHVESAPVASAKSQADRWGCCWRHPTRCVMNSPSPLDASAAAHGARLSNGSAACPIRVLPPRVQLLAMQELETDIGQPGATAARPETLAS